jgi:hypothetical protein
MRQYNIDVTLKFPDATSGLLIELQHENKVLSEQWDAMLAAIAPVPTYGFVLSLPEAKAKNAATPVLDAPDGWSNMVRPVPQLGVHDEGIYLLGTGDNNVVNFLSLDHSDYGRIQNNPGEVVALIKTMDDLAAKDNKVDWRKNQSIHMPGNVGPDHANNSTKSAAFKTLMATNLGERIQRDSMKKYATVLKTAWFHDFLDKYRAENST